MRLKGKVALLTGAAAAIKGELMGFGGAAAHLFVREGAKVVLTDIRDELGNRAAEALRAAGHDVRYMHLDVTSEEEWDQSSRRGHGDARPARYPLQQCRRRHSRKG
jgi:NAD(P)-dependent dehydrogenase (short-subunit alcohol dehydrogenase family)